MAPRKQPQDVPMPAADAFVPATLYQLIIWQYPEMAAQQRYSDIAVSLNLPSTVENPTKEAPQVPINITLKAVMAQVPVAEAVKIYQLPGYVTDLKIAIDADDVEYLAYLLQVAVAAGAISEETAGKLAPMLTATVADPSYSATINGPSLAATYGFGVIEAANVQRALHEGV